MKILKFLTSRLGAISLSAGKTAGLAVTVGLVGLNIYNFATASSSSEEGRVRSLSSIMSSGGTLPTEYSGINFDTGNVQFATAEEIAAKEGTLFDGGEAAVNALNNISVSSYALGAGEAGLGMGANAAAQIGADGQPVTGNVSADGSAVGAAAAQQAQKTQINKLGEEKAGGLQRSSIATASGSNMGSSSSGGFGAPSRSSQGSTSVKASSVGASEGYALSGSMPKGSTLLASTSEVRGAASSSSSFIAGNTRTRIGSGSNSREGRSLRDIALASAKVAANKNRAANEGASPFMAKEKLSGGVQVMDDNLAVYNGTSNTSFEDDLNKKEKAFDNNFKPIDETEKQRKADRSLLQQLLFPLIMLTIGCCLAINSLMKGGVWSKVVAVALAAGAAGLVIWYMVKCIQYLNKYNEETGMAITGIVLSGLMLVAIGVSFFDFSKSKETEMTSTANEQMGVAEGETASTATKTGGGEFASLLKDMMIGGVPGNAFDAGGKLINDATSNNGSSNNEQA